MISESKKKLGGEREKGIIKELIKNMVLDI